MNFVVVFSFPPLIASLGLGGVFALYAAACVLGLFFTQMRVPETNGISLEAIEAHLRSGLPFRKLGELLPGGSGGAAALSPRS